MAGIQPLLPGTIVYYKLKVSNKPVNPVRLWRGRVTSIARHTDGDVVQVELLDSGYEREREWIKLTQIVCYFNLRKPIVWVTPVPH